MSGGDGGEEGAEGGGGVQGGRDCHPGTPHACPQSTFFREGEWEWDQRLEH